MLLGYAQAFSSSVDNGLYTNPIETLDGSIKLTGHSMLSPDICCYRKAHLLFNHVEPYVMSDVAADT